MNQLLQELRYAARRLRHTPVFTLIVVATLALGIGANSAIFSVVNTVLLAPLPYRAPEQLMTIYHWYPSIKLEAPVSAPGYKDYRDRTHSFSSVAVEAPWNANLTGMGDPERIAGTRVSGLFFSTLGVPTAAGRPIVADDDQDGHNHVVVLSDGLWKRTFGGRRDIVGQSVQLNGEAYQVIGVMPAGFVDPWAPLTDVWSPIAINPARFNTNNYTNEFLNLVARLKPGVTVDASTKEMSAFAQQLKKDYPDNFSADWTLEVKAMSEVQNGKIRPALLMLLGAVGFVLLIACANVANLLLVRAASRKREIAIRTALGARPRDLVRQLLTESLMLSFAGGALGLAIAWASVAALAHANPARVPRVQNVAIDLRVVFFTAVLAVITGIAFGLVPAMQAWNGSLQGSLKDGARGGSGDKSGNLIRRGLVVAEIGLALTLLIGGGLLLRSFGKLASVSPGFEPHNVLTFGVALPPAKYTNDTIRAAFWRRVMPRIAEVPGVKAVGSTSVIPFGGGWSTSSFNVEGYTPPPKANGPWGDIRIVTPGFFNAMQLRQIAGRTFTEQDDDHAILAAVVDDEFVKRFYRKGENPIGKRLYFGGATPDSTTRFITIIGVVGHAAHEGLDAEPRIQLYLHSLQPIASGGGLGGGTIVVRTIGDPTQSVAAVRAALHDVDRDLPMARITTMDELLSSSMGPRRLSTILLGTFAGLALLLASLGIYGVMSYTVTQRTRELGIRVALGASHDNVMGLVLRQGVLLTALGSLLGLVGALALTRLIAAELYGIKATDASTFVGVTLLLVTVAVLATLIPARRAMRVNPIVALREE